LTVDDGQFSDTAQTTVSVSSQASVEGLISHWELDEADGAIAIDSLGSADGILINGPVWQPGGGRFLGALEFDGIDDAVDLGPLDIVSGTGITLSMWVKADDFDIHDGRFISKATGTSESRHYWMLSTLREDQLRFRLKAGGSTSTLLSSPGQLQAGVWYHISATYDGTAMRIYKDGVEVASTAKTGSIDTNPAVSAAIGNQPQGAGSRPFDGLIDDVRIYNHALTDVEIMALASSTNQSPTASFTATPDSGQAPLLVNLPLSTGSTELF